MKVMDALARIHFRRKEWKESKNIVDMGATFMKVLEKVHSDEEQKQASDNVQYELRQIQFDLALRTADEIGEETPQTLKKLIQYEKENKVPPDYKGYTYLWLHFHRPEMKKRGIKTSRDINNVPDEVLVEHFNSMKAPLPYGTDKIEFLAEITGRDPDDEELKDLVANIKPDDMRKMMEDPNEMSAFIETLEKMTVDKTDTSKDEAEMIKFLSKTTGRDPEDEALNDFVARMKPDELKRMIQDPDEWDALFDMLSDIVVPYDHQDNAVDNSMIGFDKNEFDVKEFLAETFGADQDDEELNELAAEIASMDSDQVKEVVRILRDLQERQKRPKEWQE